MYTKYTVWTDGDAVALANFAQTLHKQLAPVLRWCVYLEQLLHYYYAVFAKYEIWYVLMIIVAVHSFLLFLNRRPLLSSACVRFKQWPPVLWCWLVYRECVSWECHNSWGLLNINCISVWNYGHATEYVEHVMSPWDICIDQDDKAVCTCHVTSAYMYIYSVHACNSRGSDWN